MTLQAPTFATRETVPRRRLPAATLARQVPDLDLLMLVGQSPFAEVWLVRDRPTGMLRALKQLRSDSPNAATGRQLLWNEAEVGRRVQSEHVVRIVETRLDGRPPHLLLEWLAGETLEARLTRERQLCCAESLWIARQCAQGLTDLLAAGFFHGDVKPSNIFVGRSGSVKLIDLGFARPDKRIVDDLNESDRELTGTPEYLAPEALVPREQGLAARDLYSLGVVLYRMLAGVRPFQGEGVAETIREHQQSVPPRLRSLAPHVPADVEDLVHRLLSKQPVRRGTGLKNLVHELISLELSAFDEAPAAG